MLNLRKKVKNAVRLNMKKNAQESTDEIRNLFYTKVKPVWDVAIASDRALDPEEGDLIEKIAKHPNTPVDILREIMTWGEPWPWQVALNSALSEKNLIGPLLQLDSEDSEMWANIAGNPGVDIKLLNPAITAAFIEHPNPEVRSSFAQNPTTPLEILEHLAADPVEFVRNWAKSMHPDAEKITQISPTKRPLTDVERQWQENMDEVTSFVNRFSTFDELWATVQGTLTEQTEGESWKEVLKSPPRKEGLPLPNEEYDLPRNMPEGIANRLNMRKKAKYVFTAALEGIKADTIKQIYELEYKLAQTQNSQYRQFYAHELEKQLDLAISTLINRFDITQAPGMDIGGDPNAEPSALARNLSKGHAWLQKAQNSTLDQKIQAFHFILNVIHDSGIMADHLIDFPQEFYDDDLYYGSDATIATIFLDELSSDKYLSQWDTELRKDQPIASRLCLKKVSLKRLALRKKAKYVFTAELLSVMTQGLERLSANYTVDGAEAVVNFQSEGEPEPQQYH
ncbi:hypothetical protein LCGC14_1408270, partial [marine sediment metagenome]